MGTKFTSDADLATFEESVRARALLSGGHAVGNIGAQYSPKEFAMMRATEWGRIRGKISDKTDQVLGVLARGKAHGLSENFDITKIKSLDDLFGLLGDDGVLRLSDADKTALGQILYAYNPDTHEEGLA